MPLTIDAIQLSTDDTKKVLEETKRNEPDITELVLQSRFIVSSYYIVQESGGKAIKSNTLLVNQSYYIGAKVAKPFDSTEQHFISYYKFDTKNVNGIISINTIEYIDQESLHIATVKGEKYPFYIPYIPEFTKRHEENIELFFKKLDEGYKLTFAIIKDADPKNPELNTYNSIYIIRKYVFEL